MIETFTPRVDWHAKPTLKEEKIPFTDFAEPSKNVIKNILNFSKNLEVKQSFFIKDIAFIKS
jgi:hypothetical protein